MTFRKRRYAANAARKRASGAFAPVQKVSLPAVHRSTIQLHLRGDVRVEVAASAEIASVEQLVKALPREG